MLGLIFITWEKYLAERFGERLLQAYRSSMGETAAIALVAGRYYDDEILVNAMCKLALQKKGS